MSTILEPVLHGGVGTSMHADDAVLYERGQGQPIEERIDALPGPQPLLVPHALYALQPESKQRIDVRGL